MTYSFACIDIAFSNPCVSWFRSDVLSSCIFSMSCFDNVDNPCMFLSSCCMVIFIGYERWVRWWQNNYSCLEKFILHWRTLNSIPLVVIYCHCSQSHYMAIHWKPLKHFLHSLLPSTTISFMPQAIPSISILVLNFINMLNQIWLNHRLLCQAT